jgi:hypothetical protein
LKQSVSKQDFFGEKLEAVENICQNIKTDTGVTVKMMSTVQGEKILQLGVQMTKMK